MEHIRADRCRELWTAVVVEAIRHAHNPWRGTMKAPPKGAARDRALAKARRDFDVWIYSRDGGDVLRYAGLDDEASTRERLKSLVREGLPNIAFGESIVGLRGKYER